MTHTIKLTFSVQNGIPHLDTSSENSAPDDRIRRISGKNLKQNIVNRLPNATLEEGKLEMTATPIDGNKYELNLTLNGVPRIVILNSKFIEVLSGKQAVAPPPVVQTVTQPVIPKTPDPVTQAPAVQPVAHPPVPLINPGNNDCFMNAMFQVFMNDEKLREILIKTHPEGTRLQDAITNYGKGERFSINALRALMPQGQQVGQQDTAEFFDALMQKFESHQFSDVMPTQITRYKWVRKEGALFWRKVVEEKFTASLPEPITYIPLEITGGDGQTLINNYFTERKHAGDNFQQVYEPDTVHVELANAPERLIFLLKRFTKSSKIHDVVDMPASIEVNGSYYTLKSVVVHKGETRRSGHYISAIQSGRQWYRADDSHITLIDEPTEERLNGYMYFYQKI